MAKISDYMPPAPRTPKRTGARKFETYRATRRMFAAAAYRDGLTSTFTRTWMQPVTTEKNGLHILTYQEAPAGRQFDRATFRSLQRSWDRTEAGRWNGIAR